MSSSHYILFLENFIDFQIGEHIVLDLGCGGMTLAKELEKISSFNVIGVDLVFELLRSLSKERTPNIPIIAGDAEFLPFKTDSFDLSSTATNFSTIKSARYPHLNTRNTTGNSFFFRGRPDKPNPPRN